MPVASPVATRLRFQDFEIDLRAGELRRSGLKVRLPEKPFQVLAALLENPGEVVSREELRQRLWPGDTFVEFDDNLNHAVKTLREALTDSAEQPRFVETLPRHGYRFIAPVEVPEVPGPDETEGAEARGRARSRWLLALALVALPGLLAVLLALNVAGLRDLLLGRIAPSEISSLAVLPLDNLSGDPDPATPTRISSPTA
jgi:DNA-binding winged helix-turn-helix (wHTH) protein